MFFDFFFQNIYIYKIFSSSADDDLNGNVRSVVVTILKWE